MKHILVVEDDPIINQVICEFLKENKYQVTSVFDGQDALDQVASADFDLLILDIMLPSVNGIDVLKRVRQTSQVPIMMLTAVDDEYTQLVSFNHLISDYVVKPFSPLILLKRVENILRQEVQKSSSDSLYHLDYDNSALVYEGERIILTKKEYAILTVLIKYQGRLVTREQLMNTVWGYSELDSRVLDNHIKNIRKKCPQLPLQTMTGMGYKLGEG
ncbi:response regulator transcription factor [Streptococcus oriscaviae]|uniref:Response regulator transcription factor n=1 Tax=Streptococcus oriscaviae TaxID=2781599 RepID=A0ABX7YKB7_9STRE|nr:response regulator transcription factor [Streptococcus oriscaviae]QUE53912.1 response regulator transcription factor [Streptococcus oriscaviae]HEL1008728.1 response regulator transcription factor [Streptococcus equi subsp. zooepidemicus]